MRTLSTRNNDRKAQDGPALPRICFVRGGRRHAPRGTTNNENGTGGGWREAFGVRELAPAFSPQWVQKRRQAGALQTLRAVRAEEHFRVKKALNRRPPRLAAGLAAALLVASTSLLAAGNGLTGDRITAKEVELIVHPINHATLALGWQGKTVYVDPVGGAQRFADLAAPDLVLVTHLHGDHFDPATLKAVVGEKTALIAPPTVVEQLPAELRSRATSLANGQSKELLGLKVEAVPAYNLTPERSQFHPKGRDNGYVLNMGGLRVYLSGDTEAIPEMLALKNIDVAFLCVNLPYTMDVEQAARAAREFRPKILYPYHCRGSDLEKLKQLIGDKEGIEVRLRDWYKR